MYNNFCVLLMKGELVTFQNFMTKCSNAMYFNVITVVRKKQLVTSYSSFIYITYVYMSLHLQFVTVISERNETLMVPATTYQ